jgi:hypothetical protein
MKFDDSALYRNPEVESSIKGVPGKGLEAVYYGRGFGGPAYYAAE